MTDCTYPDAKKPLIMLSSLFCINTTSHNHISISFAKHHVPAPNGQVIDWAEEFSKEFYNEIFKLYQKHTHAIVKVERTTIALHIILILKAAEMMNIRNETDARFYKDRTDHVDHPKWRRCTDTPLPPMSPQSLQNKFRIVKPRVVKFQWVAPTLFTKDIF